MRCRQGGDQDRAFPAQPDQLAERIAGQQVSATSSARSFQEGGDLLRVVGADDQAVLIRNVAEVDVDAGISDAAKHPRRHSRLVVHADHDDLSLTTDPNADRSQCPLRRRGVPREHMQDAFELGVAVEIDPRLGDRLDRRGERPRAIFLQRSGQVRGDVRGQRRLLVSSGREGSTSDGLPLVPGDGPSPHRGRRLATTEPPRLREPRSPNKGQHGEGGERGQRGERDEHVLHAREESGFHWLNSATPAPWRAVTQVTGDSVAAFRYALRWFGYPRRQSRRHYPRTMMTYEKLDAWKVSHELVLAVWRATEKWSGPDGECLRDELRSVALLAPAKLANGSGRLTRKSFQRCVDLSLGYLIELAYLLQRGEEMGLLTGVRRRELDAVRGRAVFYTTKLFVSLTEDPETG